MLETSLFTGKVTTSGTGPNSTVKKKLYIKVFAGLFSVRPPRLKKKHVLLGELIIRYSAREWPVKKNGPLHGDPGFLEGISTILKEHNMKNYDDLTWNTDQYDFRDTVTIRVGSNLAQEFIDRGWAVQVS